MISGLVPLPLRGEPGPELPIPNTLCVPAPTLPMSVPAGLMARLGLFPGLCRPSALPAGLPAGLPAPASNSPAWPGAGPLLHSPATPGAEAVQGAGPRERGARMRWPARRPPLPGKPPPPRVPRALSGCAAGPGRSAGAAAVPARPHPQTAPGEAAGGAGPAAAAPCRPRRARPRALEMEAAAAAQVRAAPRARTGPAGAGEGRGTRHELAEHVARARPPERAESR